jgi:hypothetical protein
MRLLVGLVFGLVLATGCGPPVPKEELGTIEKKLPSVPGTEQPHKMPQLDHHPDK